ncbi:MAG: OsmC family protein [Rhodobacteraceae bacterium]|jgi:uncharacterized OsmC-like protein|nr:OsmC family protein [Paracoccaceae bacterium]
MINSIDLDQLQRAREHIAAHPAEGIARYGVGLTWQEGVRATVSTLPMQIGETTLPRSFGWTVDEPPELLGQSKGPTPQELLMSGVGACIMVGFVVNAAAKGVRLRSLTVELRGSLDLAGFMNLRSDAQIKMLGLEYAITVDCDAADEVLAEIERVAVEFSPNAMTVRNGVPLSGKVVRN